MDSLDACALIGSKVAKTCLGNDDDDGDDGDDGGGGDDEGGGEHDDDGDDDGRVDEGDERLVSKVHLDDDDGGGRGRLAWDGGDGDAGGRVDACAGGDGDDDGDGDDHAYDPEPCGDGDDGGGHADAPAYDDGGEQALLPSSFLAAPAFQGEPPSMRSSRARRRLQFQFQSQSQPEHEHEHELAGEIAGSTEGEPERIVQGWRDRRPSQWRSPWRGRTAKPRGIRGHPRGNPPHGDLPPPSSFPPVEGGPLFQPGRGLQSRQCGLHHDPPEQTTQFQLEPDLPPHH